MPDSCNLANFSGVFEVAFGLSAILYYVNLRQVIRTKIDESSKEVDLLILAAGQLVIRHMLDQPKELPEELKEQVYKRLQKVSAVRGWITELLLQGTALISSIVSLGALVYSGFYPDERLACDRVVGLLLLSYISIVVNLSYFTSVPLERYTRKIVERWLRIR